MVLGHVPVADWDEEIIHLVASGLARLAERVRADGAVRVPYPAALQRAVNRLTVLCQVRGLEPPTGVAELLRLAHQPFSEWPLRLPDDLVGVDDVLLSSGVPTRLCEEWALDVDDVEAELSERRVVLEVLHWCREMRDQQAYVQFRQLLIDRPVLDGDEFLDVRSEPYLAPLAQFVQQAYERPGAHLAAGGVFQMCGRCRNLSVPTPHGWRCVEDDCARLRYRAGRELPIGSEVWTVGRGLRTFVTGPGRAESRLLRWLAQKGYQPEPYPEFDVCDIRIPVPGRPGRWWAVDVKSWRNPALLARRLRRRPPQVPDWADRFFVVVDRERTRGRHGYVQLVNSLAPGLAEGGVVVRTEKTFLREDLPVLRGEVK
ncbi:pPIWI_RE_Y domain-containing protein [Micromonospora aurantiaca (nom. illeg.)]|uniref:pPIWI_RE_Y domain-containing protein n=1 Tax=Micromonospora aurantiaca (nom. illeg.) TaxID=47850 RepID=UPI0037A7EFA1